MRKYVVDDNFPQITDNSFKGDSKPLGVEHITYSINLCDIPNESINF